MPSASVVIPTRNRRSRLERAIRSVEAQTLASWELVVVDDASTDDTWRYLETLDDPRIRAVRLDDHAERSAARNHGLRHVTADAVLFLDDDDELLPSSLELLTRALGEHPSACAAVGAVLHDADGERRRTSFPRRRRVCDIRLELLAGWVALGGQSLMRAAPLREVGGWLEGLSLAEDQELWLRLCLQGPVALVPDPVLVHRPHGLAGDAPDGRDVERGVVARFLHQAANSGDPRAQRAATAREHLRDGHIAFERGAYRDALPATLKGVAAAPFLLASPLIGPGLARGLLGAVIGTVLPPAANARLRAIVRQRRARALSPPH